MTKKYKYIFFDLDHTIWDYDKNAEETLLDLYSRHDLGKKGTASPAIFFKNFLEVNEELWSQYNLGKISKYVLRSQRFQKVFNRSGIENVDSEFVHQFGKDFLKECPQKEAVIDGAIEILDYLKAKYPLFVITNGFEETQKEKLQSAKILQYFDRVITSENAGSKKPATRIFEYSMKACGTNVDESIFVGDNLQTDMKGARDFGMDHVFFNPNKIVADVKPTYEISHLQELSRIL